MMRRPLRPLLVLSFGVAAAAQAQGPPCRPCAGLEVADPGAWAATLAAPPALEEEARLYFAWTANLSDPAAAVAAAQGVAASGAVPWVRLAFTAPALPAGDGTALEGELAAAATIARQAPASTHYQVLWPAAQEDPRAYAFLFKRAAVALGGAAPGANVITAPLPLDGPALEVFYGEEVAAYVDGVAFRPGAAAEVEAAVARLDELDPGEPVVVDALPLAEDPRTALLDAARLAAAGAAVTLLEAPAPVDLVPFKVLANEFRGDLSYDPYSSPQGGSEAFAFVRGEDLGLRIVAGVPVVGQADLDFSDPTLERSAWVDLVAGAVHEIGALQPTPSGLRLSATDIGPVLVLRVERPPVEERTAEGGLAEELEVRGERAMPVEEILRRLQAREDAQRRRLLHYEAVNTTHLRFQSGTGVATVEATFRGSFFGRRDGGFDWAWEEFLVNGVRWRGKRIPEIPLVQPEKAAAMPLEILFTRDYRYRLRGTALVEGRDCWVVDFEPVDATAEGNLYQGTVWIDRSLYRRVKSRALQLGLEGEVISNDETLYYTPVDASGVPAAWEAAEFVLPLRVVSQQVFSVLNGSTAVEKETLLSELKINDPGFPARYEAVMASEETVLRDTEEGLRYLVKDEETGERIVQEGFDTDRLFLGGGVFYDESLDYPLPLAGVNYFSFDFRGTGAQVNAFFAGLLLNATLSDPQLRGSRFDGGVDLFALGVATTDEVFRDGVEASGEEVETRPASLALTLGRPLGAYVKLNLDYRLSHTHFGRSDDTAPEFVLPEDHLTHSLGLSARYNRAGWRLRVGGSWNERSEWSVWGLPGQPFDPDSDSYQLWSANVARNFHLPRFQRIGLDVEYLDGSNLDRFSKYGFGYFSAARVHGLQSGTVRAERAYGAHGSYGFELGEVFRLELVGDAVWASDEETGLEDELLAGAGIVGQFLGPWQTLVQLDLGVPIEAPDDDGIVLFLAFLKLFR